MIATLHYGIIIVASVRIYEFYVMIVEYLLYHVFVILAFFDLYDSNSDIDIAFRNYSPRIYYNKSLAEFFR